MSQGDTWGPQEDTLNSARSELADWTAQSFLRGKPQVTTQNASDGSAFVTSVYSQTQLGLASYSAARNRIRVYNQDHSVDHFDSSGVIQHARTSDGHTVHGSFIYHGSGAGIDPTTRTPVYPYWLIKHNPAPPLGATAPHQEHWINTTSQSSAGEVLAHWHGLDSHGLAFADATHYQFNPAYTDIGTSIFYTGSLQFPSGHSIKTLPSPGGGAPAPMKVFDPSGTVIASFPQAGGKLSSGSGAPSSPGGVNPTAGDYYFRTDLPGTALSRIYVCTVGGGSPTWVGIV